MELAAPVTAPGAEVNARVDSSALAGDGIGTATATLGAGSEKLGHCGATFAVPARGRQDPLPWDVPTVPPAPLTLGELSESEHTIPRSVLTVDDRGSWGDRLVLAATGPSGLLTPTEAMTNRSGAIQGGVLFGLAALHGAGDDTRHLVSGSMRFLSAADAAIPVLAEAVVEHSTRRTMFVRAELSQRGQLRAVAGFVFRRAARPSSP